MSVLMRSGLAGPRKWTFGNCCGSTFTVLCLPRGTFKLTLVSLFPITFELGAGIGEMDGQDSYCSLLGLPHSIILITLF